MNAGVLGWREFGERTPEFAAAAARLLTGADGISIGFLATSGRDGPQLSPVCPVFSGTGLYVIASARTPKARDLRERGVFALHAPLAENDEELELLGRAREVADARERSRVRGDVRFTAFDPRDPVFELAIARALWVFWERAGKPDTRAIRKTWPAEAESRG